MTEKRIRALNCWQGPISIEPLGGGITNLNYHVCDAIRSFAVRLCEDKSELGIDRRNERVCQQAAAQAGVSPEVVHFDDGILVTRFVEARTLTDDDLRDRRMLSRLAVVLRRLHDFRENLIGEMLYFCPFQTVRTYTANARRLGAQLPADIDDLLEDTQRMSREITAFHPTLCHNDLLAANVMDAGEKLWLVDWEYAGIGNPLFDLAGISANCRLSEELETDFLKAYCDTLSEHTRFEIRILKTVSLLREALWSVIQTVTSSIEFDYTQYAADNIAAYKNARQQLDCI